MNYMRNPTLYYETGFGLGKEAQACNLRYLGGRDQEDCDSRPVGAKMILRPHLNHDWAQ
jgi:hypothetical protein